MKTNELSSYFKILSDETRIKIILMLKSGTMCACNILKQLNITQPTLSYHMNILSSNNIVNQEKKGTWVHYTLCEEKLKEMSNFFN